MKLIIHNYGKIPESYKYMQGPSQPLDECNLEKFDKLQLDEVWYWYASAPYEGSGYVLMRRGEQYDLADLGHCSCYGPTDRISFTGYSLHDLKKSLSEGTKEEAEYLIQMAESQLQQPKKNRIIYYYE